MQRRSRNLIRTLLYWEFYYAVAHYLLSDGEDDSTDDAGPALTSRIDSGARTRDFVYGWLQDDGAGVPYRDCLLLITSEHLKVRAEVGIQKRYIPVEPNPCIQCHGQTSAVRHEPISGHFYRILTVTVLIHNVVPVYNSSCNTDQLYRDRALRNLGNPCRSRTGRIELLTGRNCLVRLCDNTGDQQPYV